MSAHTPGPWAWHGDPKHGGFYLSTTHSGRKYVMGFERMGFSSAQPSFQVNGVMVDGQELCRFEVAPNVVGVTNAKKPGSGVYRGDIIGFDHPDAQLIAAAPELLAACIQAYGKLSDVHCSWPGRHTTVGQNLLCGMRDAIAKATGIDCQTVQNGGAA